MLAADALRRIGAADTLEQAKLNLVLAIDEAAARLGNTRAVCRKYYIHHTLIAAYLDGDVLPPPPASERTGTERRRGRARLRAHEREVLAFLKKRLG